MIILTGSNLGERQHDLNTKVNKAAKNKVNFEKVKDEPENSDVDKLFKIDLASKYKNVDYIVEVLKSGDSLYISRALKCRWLYDDEYSHIINSEYLDRNIFPFMSLKMKKKTMKTIYKYVSVNEDRSANFYAYCLKKKVKGFPEKFLLHTSESFKINHMKNVLNNGTRYLKKYIGKSFTLFDTYLSLIGMHKKEIAIIDFYYLYKISNEKYLEIFESALQNKEPVNIPSSPSSPHYRPTIETRASSWSRDIMDDNPYIPYGSQMFALRTSAHIMKKHKERVLKMPALYLFYLKNKMVAKYSNSDNAKIYAVELLPNKSEEFWLSEYYRKYKYFLELIPFSERYDFLKEIYTKKYPKAEFEMSLHFYNEECYEMMTLTEREEWALRHISSKKQLHGHARDYIWYQFVNFDKAFVELKKFILIAPDQEKRFEIVKTLLQCAKEQHEVEKVLNYYYERHINEIHKNTEKFLDLVLDLHDVYEFDKNCWAAFNKMLFFMGIYEPRDDFCCDYYNLTIVSFVYHILYDLELPEVLKKFAQTELLLDRLQFIKICSEKHDILYTFLLKFYVDSVKSYACKPCRGEVKDAIISLVSKVLNLLYAYKKPVTELPNIIHKFIKLDVEGFKYSPLLRKVTRQKKKISLMQNLKTDFTLILEALPKIKSSIIRQNLNGLNRKLKIYFSNDYAKVYLKFLMELISDKNASKTQIRAAVSGVFHIADEDFKLEFVRKYTPIESKIDYQTTDRIFLNTQVSVCRFAYYSRPPVRLSSILEYVKGDYVKYCLPTLNFYMTHLQIEDCIKFIEELLQRPVSVQKHGIRFAFQNFSVENLTSIIFKIWDKSRNVSLRMVIYEELYNKVRQEDNDSMQKKLFETLKTITMDVNEEDHSDVINAMLHVNLPKRFVPEYVVIVWKTVNKLPDLPLFIEHRAAAMNNMANFCIIEIDKNIILPIITDHIQNMLFEDNVSSEDDDDKRNAIDKFNESKWFLAKKYIVSFDDEDILKGNLKLLELILTRCLEMWDKKVKGTYTMRRFISHFIKDLLIHDYHLNLDPIFDSSLKLLQDKLPVTKIYETIWDLRLVIIVRKVISRGNQEHDDKPPWEIIKELTSLYTNEIFSLIKEFMSKDMFYKTFFREIVEKLEENIVKTINETPFRNYYKKNQLFEHFAKCLLNYNLPEADLLAVHVLPTHLTCPEVIQKLKDIESEDIKCLMYNKFMGGYIDMGYSF